MIRNGVRPITGGIPLRLQSSSNLTQWATLPNLPESRSRQRFLHPAAAHEPGKLPSRGDHAPHRPPTLARSVLAARRRRVLFSTAKKRLADA